MKTTTLVLATVIALGTSVATHADSISHSTPVSDIDTSVVVDEDGSIIPLSNTAAVIPPLPQFDLAMGTLTGVEFSFTGDAEAFGTMDGIGVIDQFSPTFVDASIPWQVNIETNPVFTGGTSIWAVAIAGDGSDVFCEGDPVQQQECFEGFSDFFSLDASGSPLTIDGGNVYALDDFIGTGTFAEFNMSIGVFEDFIFFDLQNLLAATVELNIVISNLNVTVTYTFDAGIDTDADGVDDSSDNCTVVPNPLQRDTDGDGFGNFCDPDLDQSGSTNSVDLGLFKSLFFSADPDADFNGDGVVNFVDLGIIKVLFFLPPGPSGVAP